MGGHRTGGRLPVQLASDARRVETGARATRLPPLVLFAHPVLGLVGISVWIGYLSTDSELAAWLGVAVLVTGAMIGAFLGLRTERPRRDDADRLQAAARRGALDAATRADLTVAEQRIPRPAVALHGIGAATTLVLALVVALRG